MEFDGCGNRTKLDGAATTYNAMNQPNENASYDDNGNLIASGGWTYVYDAQNRLRREGQKGVGPHY